MFKTKFIMSANKSTHELGEIEQLKVQIRELAAANAKELAKINKQISYKEAEFRVVQDEAILLGEIEKDFLMWYEIDKSKAAAIKLGHVLFSLVKSEWFVVGSYVPKYFGFVPREEDIMQMSVSNLRKLKVKSIEYYGGNALY